MSVSDVQHSDSVTHTHICIYMYIFFFPCHYIIYIYSDTHLTIIYLVVGLMCLKTISRCKFKYIFMILAIESISSPLFNKWMFPFYHERRKSVGIYIRYDWILLSMAENKTIATKKI